MWIITTTSTAATPRLQYYLAHREQIPVSRPLDEAVLRLQTDKGRHVTQRGQRVGLTDLPGRTVADGHVVTLSRANQIVQSAHHLSL